MVEEYEVLTAEEQDNSEREVLVGDTWKTDVICDRKKFVRTQIAQVPAHGYTAEDQYSKESIQWLEWLMREKGIQIRHALNGGEYRVPGTKYRLDGYDPTTRTAYERLYFSRLRDVLPRSEYSTSTNQTPHGGIVCQYVEEENCPTVPWIQLRRDLGAQIPRTPSRGFKRRKLRVRAGSPTKTLAERQFLRRQDAFTTFANRTRPLDT